MSRRWTVFAIASAGAFVAFLDVTIVSVAFPAIEAGFSDSSRSDLSWVLSSYNIVLAALLVPAGRVADAIGRRRVFLGGLAAFAVASVMCAVAPTVGALIGARVLQAAAAAAIIPSSLAYVLAEFPHSERAKAAGLWGAAAGISAALGPSLGGFLISVGSWPLIFLVNLPVGVLSLIWGARALDNPPGRRDKRPDVLGAVLLIAATSLLTLGIVRGNEWGWGDIRTLVSVAAALIIALTFGWRSTLKQSASTEIVLFRERNVAIGNLGTFLFAIAGYGFILNNVLFLTGVWHYSLLTAGFALTVSPIAMAVAAGPAGVIADRYGHRVVAVLGGLVFAAGCMWLAHNVGAQPDFRGVWLPGSLIAGAGAGLAYPSLGSAAVSTLREADFGVGSALNAMSRQIGAAFGVALVIAVVGSPASVDALASFGRGWTVAVCASIAAAIVALALRRVTARPVKQWMAPAVRYEES
jgi:EmrB/QacA subfamily drug resistance transporter